MEYYEPLRAAAKYFGPELARTAYQRGLAVTDKADGSTRPIPITGTAMVLPGAELKRRQDLARRLSSAGLKMSKFMATGELKELALGGLSPLERTLAYQTAGRLDTLVTTRVDFFVGGGVKALELNATIEDFGIFVSGIMMGTLTFDLDEVAFAFTASSPESWSG